ncbi:MAG: SapC family protein [Cellvibrio sp.]|uniref:SapC family protein n=1 Tax=Cellvibrio sp. TaxID=1965322 RepID=UPI00271F6C6D|nr:SapC family protein [Cellvibrio sp.]
MQKIEVLNNIAHEHLRVNPRFAVELNDDVASTFTYVTEFSDVQKEYPILCRKTPDTEEYQAIVFFGFEKKENLFLTDSKPGKQRNLGWNADYVPAVMARGPFSIGIHREIVNGVEKSNPMVHIDVNHPKAICEDGQNLFLENGGNSPYLNHIAKTLEIINDGIPLTKLMFDAFNKHQLLESVVLDIEFQNQDKLKISGFETVNVGKLSCLNGEDLEELNRSGFLQAAYFIAASMSNIRKLIDLKNRKLLAGDN